MVVGIRVTNSAARTITGSDRAGIDGEGPAASPRRSGRSGSGPTSRMSSAISFGVFCRSAPSTMAIMRSRKVAPGCAVIAHLDPVGDDAGAAGDGRAVAAGFADHRRGFAGDRGFVDRGDALDDLAVGRDDVAGLDQHDVARPEVAARAGLGMSRRPRIDQPLGARFRSACARSVSARALPRPSASASAKLANSTVNQSQAAIWPANEGGAGAECRGRARRAWSPEPRRPR